MTRLEQQADILFANVSGWETSTLQRLGKRIKKYGKMSISDLQSINNIAVTKADMDAITKDLAQVTGLNMSQIEQMYADLIEEQHLENEPMYDYRGVKFVPYKDNSRLQAIVKSYAKVTAGTMLNLSKTKALCVVGNNGKPVGLSKYYTDVLDKAVVAVSTGATDFHSAMRNSIIELGGSGIRVDYGGGITRRLDTVVRQNLLYGAKLASVEYNEMVGEELGCDGVEIDWHSNPRPSHGFMQGKQYVLGKTKTINGEKYIGYDEPDPTSDDGKSAEEAMSEYGCLHFKTPIICGISEPRHSPSELKRLNDMNARTFDIDGRQMTGYEATQAMRRLETAVREQKRIKATAQASGDMLEVRKCNERIKLYNNKYYEITDITGISPEPKRMSITKSENKLTFAGNSGIINTGGKINDRNIYKVDEYEEQATRYYKQMMRNNSDVRRITKNTDFDEEDVKIVKNHMMSDDIPFRNGERRKFDPDIDQALAWKRLVEGVNIKETDILLFKHELEEANLIKKYGMVYEDAHELANAKFNWEDAIEDIIDLDELY